VNAVEEATRRYGEDPSDANVELQRDADMALDEILQIGGRGLTAWGTTGAATLAGLAAVAAAAAPAGDASDDDPGGAAPTAAAVAPTADDTALAATIAPVIADEDATDSLPGIDPAAPAVAAPAAAGPAAGLRAWKWAVWAAAVLLIAGVSRAVLKPAASSGRAAR
jgi:hypothetical protein